MAVFALFYGLIYAFTMPSVSGDFLPPAWLGNVDLLTYTRFTQYVLRLGPSNMAAYPDYSYLGFFYLQTPAVFYLLGALSFFFHLDPMAAAMPAAFALAALAGLLSARMARSVFGLSRATAVTVGALVISGPFFRYVFGQYFLSTLMSTPVGLLLVWTTIVHRPRRTLDLSAALRFLSAYVLLLLMYPLLFGVGVAAQLAVVGLLFVAEGQRGEHGQTVWAEARRMVARRAAGLGVALATLGLMLFARVAWSIDEALYLSQPNIAGWPLDLISPLAILGLPAAWANPEQCRICVAFELTEPAARAWAIALIVALAAGIVLSYFWRFASRTSPAQRTLAAVGGGGFAAYLAFYLLSGTSYQQWKFASYTAMPWAFAVLASTLHLVGLAACGRSARLRGLPSSPAVLATLAIVLVGGNALGHAQADPALTRFPAGT